MRAIRPVRLNHINMVLEDFDAAIAHFRALYGADFLLDLPQPACHAGLFEMGRVIFEPFVPGVWLTSSRYGPHWLGIEYQVDMDEARAAIADHGIRIVRDVGLAVHTHPADTLGIAFEFYDGSFHEREWALLDGARMNSAAHWRDAHPLGLTGLKAISIVVEALDPAIAFLTTFLSAEPVYDEARPAIGAHAIGLRIADSVLELLLPTGEGPIAAALRRYGPGIRSTILGVRDLEQARAYFTQRGVAPAEADRPDAFAIAPQANLGLMMEFAA